MRFISRFVAVLIIYAFFILRSHVFCAFLDLMLMAMNYSRSREVRHVIQSIAMLTNFKNPAHLICDCLVAKVPNNLHLTEHCVYHCLVVVNSCNFCY